MTVQCVDCRHFTLQPRPIEDDNERLRDFDLQYAAIGWGRCRFSRELSMRWFPALTCRQCDRHKPAADDLVDLRRQAIANPPPQ